MTNTAINNAENSTEVSPVVQTQTEDTNVDPAHTEATPKKRSTSSKAKTTEGSTKAEAPEEIKAAAASDVASITENQEQVLAEAQVNTNTEASEDIKKQADDVKVTHPPEAFLNGFNSKRKLEVKNNGPRSFEVYTKTPLPASETVVLELENDRLYRMVVSKFTQLNKLAGKERYTVKEL